VLTATFHELRKTRALALALLLTMVGTLALAARAEALPAKFWGVVPQLTLSEEEVQRLDRGGVESMRVPFEWSSVQPEKNGPMDWSGPDAVVERAALVGVDVLPTVAGAPAWAVPYRNVPGGGGSRAVAHLPTRGAAGAAWRKLLREAILRYGPKGSFWREHPELVKRPIRFWQIGNEPNFKYFVARPNAAEYGKLVMQSYAIVHRTDPGARLVLAGLFGEPSGCRKQKRPLSPCADDFVDQMYRKTPGLKKRFVGISLHPYTRRWQNLKPQIEGIRAVLKKYRDAGKGLWVTELGWSSKPPEPNRNVFAKGINGQRNQLRGAFRLLENKQRQWRIKRVYWFSVDDVEDSCNFCDGSGLFAEGFKPKKAWYAYVHFAGGRAN
jgi:hypothetical protein